MKSAMSHPWEAQVSPVEFASWTAGFPTITGSWTERLRRFFETYQPETEGAGSADAAQSRARH